MRLWIKTRRAHTHITVALLGFVSLIAMLGDRTVLLPSFSSGSAVSTRLALFIPVIITAALMTCLESRIHAPEASAARHIPARDAALTIVVVGVCLAAAYAIGQPTAGRNALFLSGLMLTARALVGQAAVMVPIAWLMAVMFVGYRSPGDPYPWTVVPEPAEAMHAAAASLVMFAIGLACLCRNARNTP
jgi:hypothetical protein